MWMSELIHVAEVENVIGGLYVVTISNPEGTFPYRECSHGLCALCARVAAVSRVPSIQGALINIVKAADVSDVSTCVGNDPSTYIHKHIGCLHKQLATHQRWTNSSITANVKGKCPPKMEVQALSAHFYLINFKVCAFVCTRACRLQGLWLTQGSVHNHLKHNSLDELFI